MPHESTSRTLIVALGVCLVCSILVSTAAVSLHGRQETNRKVEKLRNILAAGDLLTDKSNVEETFKEKVQTYIINLATGETVPKDKYTDKLNPDAFDIKTMANDPKYGQAIPAKEDIAKIKRMPKYMPVYEVKKDGHIQKVILLVYGKGLWSTMYGLIALGKDLRTVEGFTFYEQGETPGLGGEVDNPRWKALWKGKQAYDKNGRLIIEVIKGKVDESSPKANSEVDGLSGATLTTRGVNNLVRFWLGADGYNSFLTKLREEG
ncbi:MAG: Na(+)-translocating NADH-quinone reductase subunit C [Actinobacteria bacterium]|nr:Na(+)-translocating NADH-quinone reductase subunit C [Actinomycetota bacterium]